MNSEEIKEEIDKYLEEKEVGIDDTARFYFDWIMHVDKLFSDRAYFFIVAESMFLVGAATLINGGLPSYEYFTFLLICATGFFVSMMWLVISGFHINNYIKPIKKELQKRIPEYKKLTSDRKRVESSLRKRLESSLNIIGIVLPIVLMAVWIALYVVVFAGEQ